MYPMKKLILLFTFGVSVMAKAQDISPHVVNTTGNQFTNANFSLEYSVGEIAIATLSNSIYQLTQGFLQSDMSSTVTGLLASNELENFSIYPNPTENELYVEAADANAIEVYNQLGLMVAEYTIKEKITLSNLTSGIYFLKIYNTQNQLIKTSKITKL
jgi:hypothetical protein